MTPPRAPGAIARHPARSHRAGPSRWPWYRLAGVALVICAPFAGMALATQLAPEPAAARDEPASLAVDAFPAQDLADQAKAEVLRLTRRLALVRKEHATATGETRRLLEEAVAALSEGRAGFAIVSRALGHAPTPVDAATVVRARADADAAEAAVRRADALLAQARRRDTAAPAETSAPAALPDPAPPEPAVAADATQGPPAPPPALFRILTPPAADRAKATAEPPAQPEPEPESAPPPETASNTAAPPPPETVTPPAPRDPTPPAPPPPLAGAPKPAGPARPAAASTVRPAPPVATAQPQPGPPPDDPSAPTRTTTNALRTLDPLPATGPVTQTARLTATTPAPDAPHGSTLVDNLGRTLPSPPAVEMTGTAALPPEGQPPFERGGPADWRPALNPLARPPGDPSVVVHPDFAGPAVPDALPAAASTRAYADTAPARTRPLELAPPGDAPPETDTTPPEEPKPRAAAPPPEPTPTNTATPPAPSRPPPADRDDPPPPPPTIAETETTAAPPPPPAVAAPAPLPRRTETAGVQPFALGPADSAPPAESRAPDARAQFADIAVQVAAHHTKAKEILGQIDPVRSDLTRRMEALAPDDPRRAGMAEVRDIITTAESSLRAAVTRFGALSEQLRVVLAQDPAPAVDWTPRDAARQAIAASTKANQGVNGLKQAMARFEAVMTQGTTRLTPGALAQ